MAGDKKSWSQKIQNDKSFAEGYKGLTSVKAILKKAKEDGYNLKESEITKDDVKALEAVAGGWEMPQVQMPQVQMPSVPNTGGSGDSVTAMGGGVGVKGTVTATTKVVKVNEMATSSGRRSQAAITGNVNINN